MTDTYWTSIDQALGRIRRERPAHAADVASILREHGNPGRALVDGAAQAFFGGEGGDLLAALLAIGWVAVRINAGYYWAVSEPNTGAVLSYVEGDVYERNVLL